MQFLLPNERIIFGFINFLTDSIVPLRFFCLFVIPPMVENRILKQNEWWADVRHAARNVMYFKNGFKFHFVHPVLCPLTLHFALCQQFESFRGIYSTLLCHLQWFCSLRSSHSMPSITIIKRNIANILRKSDQLRGVRDGQIKDFKNLYPETETLPSFLSLGPNRRLQNMCAKAKGSKMYIS